jgi:hypothetical protein
MAFLRRRFAAGFLDQVMRLEPAELCAECDHDGFGHDLPAGCIEVGTHTFAVDLETFADLDRGTQRARGDEEERRKRRPLGLPGPRCALVLADLGRKDGGAQIRCHCRGGERDGGSYRIAFLRHGRGTAAARGRRLARLRDVGLHQQRDVACNLAAGADEYRERRRDLGETVAMGMPGRLRQRQAKLGCKSLRDGNTCGSERRQRSGGAAELENQRLFSQSRKALARTRQRRRVAGEFQPERDRQRVLQPGAAGNRRCAIAFGERREGHDSAAKIGIECI